MAGPLCGDGQNPVADGPGPDIVTSDLLKTVFGVRGRVWHDELTGRPLCAYDSVD